MSRGVFGARMDVELVNDGPVTIVLETSERDPLLCERACSGGRRHPGQRQALTSEPFTRVVTRLLGRKSLEHGCVDENHEGCDDSKD